MEEVVNFSEDRLPPLRFRQFEGRLKRARMQHQPQMINPLYLNSQKSAPSGVYTVMESLQDEFVVKNLDLDLGSLPQFMDLKAVESQPLLLPNVRLQAKSKKAKKEAKDNDHEIFLRKVNVQQVQMTPFEVLKYEEDEKKRGQAARDIVHMIFRKIYGEDIDKFEEKNSRALLQQKYLEGGVGEDMEDPS